MKATSSAPLLGILLLGPRSGYDISKFVADNMQYFWKESYGQIYPMLKRMAETGLVEMRAEKNEGRLERQVYSITPAGRAVVEEWFAAPPSEPSPRNELILKLFFGRFAKPAELIRHVEATRRRQQDLVKRYEGVEQWLLREKANDPGLPYWLITLDYGKRCANSLLEWSETALEKLEKLPSEAKQ